MSLINRKKSLDSTLLLRKFYQDYLNQNKIQLKEKTDPFNHLNKTNSAEKMSNYLQNQIRSKLQQTQRIEEQAIRLYTQQDLPSYRLKKNIHHKKKSVYNHQTLDIDRFKQTTFKNFYSQSHPFFRRHQAIKMRKLDYIPTKSESIQQNYRQIKTNSKIQTPSQRHFQMTKLKNTLSRMKQRKKEIANEIRHNYIIEKRYRQNECEQNFSYKINKISRNEFNITRQNIFPTCDV